MKLLHLVFLISNLLFFIYPTSGQVQIVVDARQKKHTISPMIQGQGLIYCFEADSIYADGKMARLFKDVGAGFLRYPGGAVTTMYHWSDLNGHGWTDHWNEDYDRANDMDPVNYMDLDEYMELCEASNLEPMLGINMSSGRNYNRQEDGLMEAVALLKYCNANNYEVKYLYLDNENHHKKWPVEEYANQVNYYADSLKKYAPDAKLIANWTDKVRTNTGDFSKLVNMAGHNFDYIDIHWYWKWTEGSWSEWIAKTPMENETEWYDGDTYVGEIAFFNELMAQLGHPEIKLAVMEWNIGPGKYREDPAHNHFRTALMQSEMQMQMMQGGLEIASLWSTQWPGDADSDFRFLVSSSNHYEPTPTAEFFKLYAHALNGVLVHSVSGDRKVMTAAVTGENERAFVYVLNKNAEKKAINISMTGLDNQSVEQVLCFQEPGITQQIDFQQTGAAGCSFDAPGYSLSMVAFSFDNGTSEQAENEVSQIRIYPNPASDQLTFSTGSINGNTIINLYDVAGRVVFTDVFQAQLTPQYSMSTSGLGPGYYLMFLSDDNGKQFSAKILKN